MSSADLNVFNRTWFRGDTDGGKVVGECGKIGDGKLVVDERGVCSFGKGSIIDSFKGSIGEIDWKDDFDKDWPCFDPHQIRHSSR